MALSWEELHANHNVVHQTNDIPGFPGYTSFIFLNSVSFYSFPCTGMLPASSLLSNTEQSVNVFVCSFSLFHSVNKSQVRARSTVGLIFSPRLLHPSFPHSCSDEGAQHDGAPVPAACMSCERIRVIHNQHLNTSHCSN